MIKDPPVLTIRRKFERPTDEQMKPFRGAMTGHIVDSMDGRGGLSYDIKPQQPETSKICGPALTCFTYPADNLALKAAIDLVQPGDVVVCATDSFRHTAVTGDLVAGMLKNAGAIAIVTDGLVRDQDGIEDFGLPIFHAGVTPNSPAGIGPGTVGLPVTCGGVRVEAGDLVVGDRDGVVIVPRGMIDATAARLEDVLEAEKVMDAAVRGGLTVPEPVKELLASDRVVEVE